MRTCRNAILFFLLLTSATTFAQSNEPRVTPLGTQMPLPPVEAPTKDPPVVLENLETVLQKAIEARKGAAKVQRIMKQSNGEVRVGSDGTSNWLSFNGMTTPVHGGLVGSFIESQTTRAVGNLLDSAARGSTIHDGGMKDESRVLEVEGPDSGKPEFRTRYSIDKATSRVTRIEWITGEAKTLPGETIPTTEAYTFSDFRKIQGVSTPFRMERFVNGIKIEETRLTSVRYNTSIKDDVFNP
jgi:hypothetical protein